MEDSAWTAFIAAALGGAHGVMLTAWIARARFWRGRDDELIPAAREFAANHRRLALQGDNFSEWSAAHKRLQPVEHFLPLWLQDGLNDQAAHGPDALDEARTPPLGPRRRLGPRMEIALPPPPTALVEPRDLVAVAIVALGPPRDPSSTQSGPALACREQILLRRRRRRTDLADAWPAT